MPLNGNIENQGLADVTITNNGATVDNNGKIGKCYSFNGGTITAPAPKITNKITVAAWIKAPDNNSGWRRVCGMQSAAISWQSASALLMLNGTNLYFSISSGSTCTSGGCVFNISDSSNWFHACGTYDGTTARLYVNGILKKECTIATTIENTPIWLGGTSAGERFTGKLNDFRLYDECLSADQIKEISRGMVLHYKMYMPINRLNAKTCTPQNGSWTTSPGYNIIISQKDDYFEFTGSPNAAARSFNGILLSTPFTGKTLKYFWSEVSGVSEFYGYTSGNNDMDFYFSGATVGSPIHAKLRLALYDDNCDFYIPFDTRNIEYDGSGFKNHGTVSGNVTLSADSPRYTGSYSLANGKYITAPGLTYINSGSISFWTKINTLASNGWLPFTGPTKSHYIMATSHGADVFYHNSIGNGTKTIYEDGKVVTAPTSNGIWHHYVITNIDLTTWTKFMLNNYESNWNAELQMSDVRVYSTVLDATDVAELYKLGRV